jgi:hypothetical protein
MHIQQRFEPFEKQLNVPARSIQAQHLLVAPLLARQGGNVQEPACQIERVLLKLALPLAGQPFLPALRSLPLLWREAQGDQARAL